MIMILSWLNDDYFFFLFVLRFAAATVANKIDEIIYPFLIFLSHTSQIAITSYMYEY